MMKIHGLTTITGLTAALIFSAPVLAESDRESGKVDNPTQRWESFENLDQNQDGQLTPSEAGETEELTQQWDTYDKDSSGTLDQSEFSAFEEEHEIERHEDSGKVDNPTQRWEEMDEKEEPKGMAE